MRYINAADILPEHILCEVQKYWQGIIYVPRPENLEKVKSSKEIRTFILKGFSAKDVANICNISVRRVYDIAKQLGESNPYRRVGHRKSPCRPNSE